MEKLQQFGKLFNFMELTNFLNHYKQLMSKPNCNDIRFVENIDNKENIDEFKGNFVNLIGNNKKMIIIICW